MRIRKKRPRLPLSASRVKRFNISFPEPSSRFSSISHFRFFLEVITNDSKYSFNRQRQFVSQFLIKTFGRCFLCLTSWFASTKLTSRRSVFFLFEKTCVLVGTVQLWYLSMNSLFAQKGWRSEVKGEAFQNIFLTLSLGFLTASPCITVALLPNESVVLTLPWRTWWRASREGRLSGFLGSFERTHRYFTWRTGVERRKGLVVLRKGYGKWGGWDENKKWWEEWDEVCCVQSSKWWILSTSMWRVQCLF